MRSFYCTFCALILMASPGLLPIQAPPKTDNVTPSAYYGASHALLIGINKYDRLPKATNLQYAVSDVTALADILVKRYGFVRRNIQILKDGDATKTNVEQALAQLADSARVKPQDRILVYFSGHGQTLKLPSGTDMGFLVMSDARVDLSDTENAGPFLATCLRMDTLWSYLEASPAKHTLVLADACYSGLLTQSRGAKRKLSPQELSNLRAMQVITGGDRGQKTVEDASWGHGAFTYKLLEELSSRAAVPGRVFTASDLHSSLAKSVADLTRNAQTPLLGNYKTDDGEFLFVTTSPSQVSPKKSRLVISTTPPGAKLFVDGADSGMITPTEIDIETPSAMRVEIATELPNYKTTVKSIKVTPGTETVVPDILLVRNKNAAVSNEFPIQSKINPVDGAEMVWVPEGSFMMGDADPSVADMDSHLPNNPPHKVRLSGFWIYKYPVTVAQYEKFCKESGGAHRMPPAPSFNLGWRYKDHPIVVVSWADALAYSAWARVRLPTDAEWERAARGPQNGRYPWGNTFDLSKLWCSKTRNSDAGGTASVYRTDNVFTNGFGCVDIVGNVWQWCRDWYDPNFSSSRLAELPNPVNESLGARKLRVVRGGSWGNETINMLSATFRGRCGPEAPDQWLGFRCASGP